MQMLGMHQEERQANTQTKKKEEVFINHFGSDFVHDGRVVVRHSSCCFCVFFFLCMCVFGMRCFHVSWQARAPVPASFPPVLLQAASRGNTDALVFADRFFFLGGGTVDFTNLQSSK